MIETICPKCGNAKTFSEDKTGRKFKCPSCGEVILVEGIASAVPVQAALPAAPYVKNIVSDEDRLQDIIGERIANNAQMRLRLLKRSKTWNGWRIVFYVIAAIALVKVVGGEPAQIISVGFWGGLGYWFQKKAKGFKAQADGIEDQNSPPDEVPSMKESQNDCQPVGGKIDVARPL